MVSLVLKDGADSVAVAVAGAVVSVVVVMSSLCSFEL